MRQNITRVVLAATLLLPWCANAAGETQDTTTSGQPQGAAAAPKPADSAAADSGKQESSGDERSRRDDPARSVTYGGIGLSKVSPGFDNAKDAVNIEVLMGFRIPDINVFAVELEIGATMLPGQVTQTSTTGGGTCPITDPLCTPPSSSTTSSNQDFQMQSLAAYAVFRSPGTVYALGKLGYRYLSTSLPELENDRSGNAWSLGAGYRYRPGIAGAELFYTHMSDHIKYYGFTLSYGFGGSRRD